MTNEQFNFICRPFQFLTNRHYNFQNIYDGEYKCYDPNLYGVRNEYLKFLKNFEHLTFRHIFTPEHIATQIGLGIPVDSNLVVIEENRICVHQELGNISFHILASKLKTGIQNLIYLLEQINLPYHNALRPDENRNILCMKMYKYNDFILDFENLTDYKYVKNLFYDTKSGVIDVNLENEIEFKIYRMKRIIEHLKIFNFENIQL